MTVKAPTLHPYNSAQNPSLHPYNSAQNPSLFIKGPLLLERHRHLGVQTPRRSFSVRRWDVVLLSSSRCGVLKLKRRMQDLGFGGLLS